MRTIGLFVCGFLALKWLQFAKTKSHYLESVMRNSLVSLKRGLIQVGRRSPWGHSIAVLALVAGLGGAAEIIAPRPAQAYLAELGVTIDNGSSDSYTSLLRRAEQVARAAAQRTFDNDILVTGVAATITGNYRGLEVPILTLNVNRNDWRAQPDPKLWSTYYSMSKRLLGFGAADTEF
jgi:hypothetical protein